MQRLYLMRHGEARLVDGQDDHHHFSLGDEPLSQRGRQQARAMAELMADLEPEAILTSPARRCRGTAELVAEHHDVPVKEDKRLWELPFGDRSMTEEADYETVLGRIVQLARDLYEQEDPALPGGHSFRTEAGRYRAAIDDALARFDEVVVVGHGAQNRAYLAELLDMPAHRLFRIEQDHACLNVIGRQGGRQVLLKLNLTVPTLWSEASSLGASGPSKTGQG